MNNSPTRKQCFSQQIINSQQVNSLPIHQDQNNEHLDNPSSQFDLQQYLDKQVEEEEDFFNYVHQSQNQEDQKLIRTQESQSEQFHRNSKGQIQYDFGNNTDRCEGQVLNSKGFKANKQPIVIKNMKKWRLKQKQKQIQTFDSVALQSVLPQNQTTQLNSKQYVTLGNGQKTQIRFQSNRQSQHESEKDLQNYEGKNDPLLQKKIIGEKSDQIMNDKAISPRSNYNENMKNKVDLIESENKSNIVNPSHLSSVSIKLYNVYDNSNEVQDKNINLKQILLQKKLNQQVNQLYNSSSHYSSPKIQNSNPKQFLSRKFSLTEKITSPILPQITQLKNQTPQSQQRSPQNGQGQSQILYNSQSDLDSTNKHNRSLSLNTKQMKLKNNLNTSTKGTSTPNAFVSQQEFLQNYFNTADTNQYLLATLTKGVIQPPPLALQSDSVFIPKVMTRNASFLKKGVNPTENIALFNNSSNSIIKYKENRQKNHNISQKENIQKPTPNFSSKINKDVLQFHPQISTNSPKSQQILNLQSPNFNNNQKSYLFFQNKFLGQKQHEFLMSNFKSISKISSQNLKEQSLIAQQEQQSSYPNKLSQQKPQQLSYSTSERVIQNKQNEQKSDLLSQRDNSLKRIPICSFINQASSHQLYKGRLNDINKQETIYEQENTVEIQDEEFKGTEDITKLEFDDLQKYYDEKYQQKILKQSNLNKISKKNKNNLKLNNILKGLIQNKSVVKEQKQFNENEEFKQSEFNKIAFNQEEEDEIEQLKPWNID